LIDQNRKLIAFRRPIFLLLFCKYIASEIVSFTLSFEAFAFISGGNMSEAPGEEQGTDSPCLGKAEPGDVAPSFELVLFLGARLALYQRWPGRVAY
jgi:hypothetical protein